MTTKVSHNIDRYSLWTASVDFTANQCVGVCDKLLLIETNTN